LKKFLAVLEQKGVINFWDDSQLQPGVPWEEQINDALRSAKAGLLLVSQEFLNSTFIADTELPRLLSDSEKNGKKDLLAPSESQHRLRLSFRDREVPVSHGGPNDLARRTR